MSINKIRTGFSLTFNNSKYHTFNPSGFNLKLDMLSNGKWIPINSLFGPKDTLTNKDFKDINLISSIKINNLFYNNQTLSLSDWFIESIYITGFSKSEKGVIKSFEKAITEEHSLIKELTINKNQEIWINQLKIPDNIVNIEFIFNIQLKNHSKIILINTKDIEMNNTKIHVFKIKTENNLLLLSDGSKTDSYRGIKPNLFMKTFIETIDVLKINDKQYAAYFELKEDNLLNELYSVQIETDSTVLLDETEKILGPNCNKIFFEATPSFNHNKIYMYDGRIHSLINPVNNKLITDDEVKKLVKSGYAHIPIIPDINVYLNNKKIKTDTNTFLNNLNYKTIKDFKFLSIDQTWINNNIYECAELMANNLYKKNIIKFDKNGNAFVPLIPREWLLVKKVRIVNNENKNIKKGIVNIFNPNGSAYYTEYMENVATISFIVEFSEGLNYTIELDEKQYSYNPNKPNKIETNNFDLIAGDLLKEYGYTYMYLSSRFQRFNIENNDQMFEIKTEPKLINEETNWWGSIKDYELYKNRWYESWFSTVSKFIPVYNKIEKKQEEILNPYFEIEVRHIDDNSLVLDSYISARKVMITQTESMIPMIKTSEEIKGETNIRRLTYGSTGLIKIPEALEENIEISVDPTWARYRNFKIKKGSEIINKYNKKAILYVDKDINGDYTGYGVDNYTDSLLNKKQTSDNFFRIEVRNTETKELIPNSEITINNNSLILTKGFVSAEWNKIGIIDINLNEIKNISIKSDWAENNNYIPIGYNQQIHKKEDFSGIGFTFNEEELNPLYRTNILWVKPKKEVVSNFKIIPEKFYLKINLGSKEILNAAENYISYEYITDQKELNIAPLIKSILNQLDINLELISIQLICNEYAQRMETGFITSTMKKPVKVLDAKELMTGNKNIRDTYIISKNFNYIDKEYSKPIRISIKRNLPATLKAGDSFNVSDGNIEVEIARHLKANPEDIRLEQYDKIEILQHSLSSFVYIYNIDKNQPIYGSILRDLEFTGNLILTDDEIKDLTISEINKTLTLEKIRKQISEDKRIPVLPKKYDQCFKIIKLFSPNVEIIDMNNGDKLSINEPVKEENLNNISYFVAKDTPYITKKGFEIIEILFEHSGTYRLNQNYLTPILKTAADGSEIIKGYTPEKMLYQTSFSLKDKVNKTESEKLILTNLSNKYKMISKLMKKTLITSDNYLWNIKNAYNQFNDEEFSLYIANDNLYAKTIISVNKYTGIFYIPILTYKNRKKAMIISKEQLKNYIPKDQYGYVYKVVNESDYDKIKYTIINESSDILFKWEETNKASRKGIDNIFYESNIKNIKTYSLYKTITEYIPRNTNFKIIELDKEQFRPLNNDEIFDKTKSLSNVNYQIINRNELFDICWENKSIEQKGLSAIVVRRKS
jgi:hypothetical protein